MGNALDERIQRFEYHMNVHVLCIAEELARQFAGGAGPLSHSGFFILSGIASYFETVYQFITGENSERDPTTKRQDRSKQFFRQGFRLVYASSPLRACVRINWSNCPCVK